MHPTKPSVLRRALAVLVLGVIAVVALRFVVGFVTGLLWLVVAVGLVAGFFWARSTLRAGRRRPDVTSSRPREITPAEDRVEAEMRRITEQLREQGRR